MAGRCHPLMYLHFTTLCFQQMEQEIRVKGRIHFLDVSFVMIFMKFFPILAQAVLVHAQTLITINIY